MRVVASVLSVAIGIFWITIGSLGFVGLRMLETVPPDAVILEDVAPLLDFVDERRLLLRAVSGGLVTLGLVSLLAGIATWATRWRWPFLAAASALTLCAAWATILYQSVGRGLELAVLSAIAATGCAAAFLTSPRSWPRLTETELLWSGGSIVLEQIRGVKRASVGRSAWFAAGAALLVIGSWYAPRVFDDLYPENWAPGPGFAQPLTPVDYAVTNISLLFTLPSLVMILLTPAPFAARPVLVVWFRKHGHSNQVARVETQSYAQRDALFHQLE